MFIYHGLAALEHHHHNHFNWITTQGCGSEKYYYLITIVAAENIYCSSSY